MSRSSQRNAQAGHGGARVVHPAFVSVLAFSSPLFAALTSAFFCTRVAVVVAIVAASSSVAAAEGGATATEAPTKANSVYSSGGWSTLHRGPENRKLATGIELADDYSAWTALAGSAVLTAPTMSPDGKTMYVTTGKSRGSANLHAFDLDGNRLWRADAYASASEGIDPCAILSSAIVDQDGDLYLGDCNQLFAYHGDGRLKWVVDLPPLREGDWSASSEIPVNALTTAAFTASGDVFGVTNMGDVVVFDRATGRSRVDGVRLPGGLPPAASAVPMPATVFGGGLIDPAIRTWAWELLMGGSMRSANTPAVDLETGRIFVAATSANEGHGALYGIDLVELEGGLSVEIAFAADMGLGSGSSPALSPERDRVYVSDDQGNFYSIDALSGEVHWTVPTKAASAAAAVGANGDVFALQAFGPALIAISREGQVRWESDLAALAVNRLPGTWFFGEPRAIGNGNPTVLDDVVLLPVVYGYELTLGRTIPWPVESSLVAVDLRTGKGLRDVVSLEDDSTGITAILSDGTIVNSLGTALTSGTTPLQRFEWMLPGDRVLLRSLGGIQVSRPVRAESMNTD